MARRPPPKYPNQARILRRRLIRRILVLVLLAGGALLYFHRDNANAPGEAKNSPDRPAETRVSPESGAERADRRQGSGGPDKSGASGLVSEKNSGEIRDGGESALPAEVMPDSGGETNRNPGREGTAPSGPERQAGTLPAGKPPSTEDSLRPSAPGNASYAAMPLRELAALFSRRHAGKTPVAFGEKLPGILSALPASTAGTPEKPVIALTFDACGGKKGSDYDAGLIAFLRENRIPATLFLTTVWIRNNPRILADLAADPLFEIAAHGTWHKPCSLTGKSAYGIAGTASFAELLAEVEGNARDLAKATGKRPRWFRSGTAHYDDIAVSVIRDLGFGIAGYGVAGDEGARLSSSAVAAKTLSAKPGDILLFHMNRPKSGTRDGLKEALPKLLQRGARFVRLSEVLSADER
jgi:peptidoglycan/xylan/chitin deacetylase (PgdA/CDA1 family)